MAGNTFGTLLVILAAGLLAERAARALRVPDIVVFLAGGLLVGPVLGWVRISAQGGLAGFVLTFGAVFMLYDGGRRLGLSVLREIWLGLALLSTLGVAVTAAVVALGAHFLAGLPWAGAGLVAAVVAPTDPASVIPLFRSVRVRPRLARLLETESGCNDAVGAALVFAMLAALGGGFSVGATLLTGLRLMAGGVAVGLAVGALAAILLPGGRGPALFDTREQGAMLSLVIVLGSAVAASMLGASPYMAVFVAGVVTGNRERLGTASPAGHRRLHEAYLGHVATLVRMLIFVVLGVVVDPGVAAHAAGAGAVVTLVLVFLARPLAVVVSLGLDRRARWSRGEMGLGSWVRETGVLPAALAGILLQRGIPGAPLIAAVVFITVIGTLLLQVPTTAWWARRCGVLADPGGSD